MYYKKFRRLRKDQATRDRNAEVSLKPIDFIHPYFVVPGSGIKQEIKSLPGVYHFSIDELIKDVEQTASLDINKILLFGVIEQSDKDELGTAAYAKDNLICRAVKELAKKFPEISIATDVCLCGYTTHGHCGLVKGDKILNKETLPLLAKIAVRHAEAGAGLVAPSSMMDGQVLAIQEAFIANGINDTGIMSYAAKFASNFYGPFRDAVKSAPAFGDRKTYQLDYRTTVQALHEINADIEEGADIIIIKPAHTYLDIITSLAFDFALAEVDPKPPVVGYHTSGEYMMLKTAAQAGLLDEKEAMLEVLTAIKRAGADFIITYYAKEILK